MNKYTCIIVPCYKGNFMLYKNSNTNTFSFPEITINSKEPFKQCSVILKKEISDEIQKEFGFYAKCKDGLYNALSLQKKKDKKGNYVVIVNYDSFCGCGSFRECHLYTKSIKKITDENSLKIMKKFKNRGKITLTLPLILYCFCFLFIYFYSVFKNIDILDRLNWFIVIYTALSILCPNINYEKICNHYWFGKFLNCTTLDNLIKNKLFAGCVYVLVSYFLTGVISFLFISVLNCLVCYEGYIIFVLGLILVFMDIFIKHHSYYKLYK